MSNFKADIEEALKGERVDGVVVGLVDGGWDDENPRNSLASVGNGVLAWSDVVDELDYEYSSDYGAAECNAVYIWTPTRVLFVDEGDGCTTIAWVPRDPEQVTPSYDGESISQ